MIQTLNIDHQEREMREEAFYRNPFDFSFSSGNLLLETPREFYTQYVLKEREVIRAKHLILGSLTHFITLEQNNFSDHFAVLPEGLPGDKARELIEEIYKIYKSIDKIEKHYSLEDFGPEILEVMKEMNYYQNLKDDNGRLAKATDSKNEEYFQFLISTSKKEVIDGQLIDQASRKAEAIRSDNKVSALMGLGQESTDTYAIYHELEHRMDLDGYPFGLKGILDNCIVDVSNKKIVINDLKTTFGKLQDFPESVEKWNYKLQIPIYEMLIRNFLKDYIPAEELKKWTFERNFVVIDKFNHVYPFRVSDNTFALWQAELEATFEKWLFHYNQREYTLPYNFLQGDVVL